MRADEKNASGLACTPGEEVPDLEDAEALSGRVVGPTPLGDPCEACHQDLVGLQGDASPQLGLLELGLYTEQWVGVSTELPEVRAGGQPEQVAGVEGGPQGEADAVLIELAPQTPVDRWCGLHHESLLSGRGKR